MSTNINLLLHRDEELLKQKKRLKIFNLVAFGSLIAVGVISLSIFLLTQAVGLSSVKKDQEDTLKNMSQFKGRQANLFILNNRVDNIDKILKTKKDLSKTMGGLLAKIPSDLSIENFEVSGQTVLITGQSNSLAVIGELINNLTNMVRKKEIIKSLTLESLILDSGNLYKISLKSEL